MTLPGWLAALRFSFLLIFPHEHKPFPMMGRKRRSALARMFFCLIERLNDEVRPANGSMTSQTTKDCFLIVPVNTDALIVTLTPSVCISLQPLASPQTDDGDETAGG